MFSEAGAFNQDLSKWNVARVTGMRYMFAQANAFNQDLSKWNVGRVTDMKMMFNRATSFTQVLCGEAWVNSEANQRSMFIGSPGSISCDRFGPQSREELVTAVNSC